MNPLIKPISVVLKEARQNKGISLEEAYNATRIHPKILHALEEGTTLGLSHVYVKSYIKIYAKFLGISQHELDKYLHTAAPKEKKVNLEAAFITERENIQNFSRLHILSDLYSQIIKFKRAIIVFAVFLVLFTIPKCFHKKGASPAEKPVSKANIPVVQIKNTETKEKIKEEKKAPLAKVGEILRLTIFAQEDTWMEVKVDGKTAFKRILKKSSSETWQAKDKFELWLGNAGTVKLELNEKILSPIGRRGQRLRSVLITREGLNIRK